MKCKICEKEIGGEYLQANVNENLKATDDGAVVCSRECAREYELSISHDGNPIQHWSRITGYYQNVSGWNKGKIEELKDRRRYGV